MVEEVAQSALPLDHNAYSETVPLSSSQIKTNARRNHNKLNVTIYTHVSLFKQVISEGWHSTV